MAGLSRASSDDLNVAADQDIWQAFADWVRTTTDDVARMYAFAAGHALVDPISIALWSRHSGEFVESGGAYLARAEGDLHDGARELQHSRRARQKVRPLISRWRPTLSRTPSWSCGRSPAPEAAQENGSIVATRCSGNWSTRCASRRRTRQLRRPPTPQPHQQIQDLTNLLNQVAHLQIGLERCAINPVR